MINGLKAAHLCRAHARESRLPPLLRNHEILAQFWCKCMSNPRLREISPSGISRERASLAIINRRVIVLRNCAPFSHAIRDDKVNWSTTVSVIGATVGELFSITYFMSLDETYVAERLFIRESCQGLSHFRWIIFLDKHWNTRLEGIAL